MTQVAAVLLAAGEGSRVDGHTPKPLLELGGRALVDWAVDAIMTTDLRPVVMVVGHHGPEVAAHAPAGAQVVHAKRWKHGIAKSLGAALQALEPFVQVSAACIGLADQPLIGPEAYRRLAKAHADGAELAVATYDGNRRNPVLVGRTMWDAARELEGDEGARRLMHEHEVVEVDCTDTGDPTDVDTLDDLRELEKRVPGR